jgi:hypothetical protein
VILSVSRRTDIPACYSEWFMNRLRAGYVCVRNPYDPHRVSRIRLERDTVDIILFWTKNPIPLIPYLDEIEDMGFPFYFQFTLTPYNEKIEPGFKNKQEIIDSFIYLSKKLGRERIIWRYDPVIVSDEFSVGDHIRAFEKISDILCGYTNKCIISFIDIYSKMSDRGAFKTLSSEDVFKIAQDFSRTGKRAGLNIQTCAESADLGTFGIEHGACIDGRDIERITGGRLVSNIKMDAQRKECRCIECVDIGEYDTCLNGCSYCYANSDPETVKRKNMEYDPHSDLLTGHIAPEDKVTDRKVRSLLRRQMELDVSM